MSGAVSTRCPVGDRIQGIFVHVSDLDRATAWYAALLGQTVDAADRYDHLHVLRLENTHLILDTKGFRPRQDHDVLFMLDSDDIAAARAHVAALGLPVVREIEHAGPVSFFNIADPDGNVVMICQQHG